VSASPAVPSLPVCLARSTRVSSALGMFSALGMMWLVASAGCSTDDAAACQAAASGTICSVAGTGERAFNGDGLPMRASALYWPTDLEFAPDGTSFILDWQNHRVRRAGADGRLTTVIGTDSIGDGPDEGDESSPPGVPGDTVNLNHPTDIQIGADGTLWLAAWHNHKVRQFSPVTGLAAVSCGSLPGFSGDGAPAAKALLNQPKAIALSARTGVLYVIDTRNLRVRRILPEPPHLIETVAGSGAPGFSGDGGPPLQAQFVFQEREDNPEPGGGIAVDERERLYIADTENQRIRRIDFEANTIETIAGNGAAGFSGDGGPALEASLNYPRDIELGPDGRLYIADTDNHRVRAVDLATGLITTVAGNGAIGYTGDGGPAVAAALARPFGIAFAPDGHLYVADTFNNRIRKVVR
jgi:sugar lactone lactonase YvrE